MGFLPNFTQKLYHFRTLCTKTNSCSPCGFLIIAYFHLLTGKPQNHSTSSQNKLQARPEWKFDAARDFNLGATYH